MRWLATLILCLLAFPAVAKPSLSPITSFAGDRYAGTAQLGPEVVRSVHKQRKSKKPRRIKVRHVPGMVASMSLPRGMVREVSRVIGGRPAGCPSRFCGCGASLHLFGRIIPSLNLAANWLRFPRAVPAPKMAAARRGHVFVLERHIAGNIWLVHDSNSGGRRTRIHPRSIAGYTIVNPHVRSAS
jgi:hypothetical protein